MLLVTLAATFWLAVSQANRPVAVAFCDLVREPELYANRRVVLTSHVVVGFETFALTDDSCPTDNTAGGFIWLETSDPGPEVYYPGWSMREFIEAIKAGELPSRVADLTWLTPLPVAPLPEVENKN